jgi:hypothetical protein
MSKKLKLVLIWNPVMIQTSMRLPLLIVFSPFSLFWNRKFWEELIAYFPWCDTAHMKNDASNSSIVACVFVTAVKFLPSCCLATIRGFLTSRCLHSRLTRSRRCPCVSVFVYLPIVARQWLGKSPLFVARQLLRFLWGPCRIKGK